MLKILLATYNGEAFLAQQIESLLGQTMQDFTLYIQDDCSTDKTFAIVQQYASSYPGKIFASQREKNSGSAKYNFLELMLKHRSDYIMLCDQDDVWLPNKIEVTLAEMKRLESEFGNNIPLLVHTDLRVVDEKLETISPSFRKTTNADYSRTELRHQIIQNTLTGCTALYNRALADLIYQAPPFFVMHDWWLMLVASAFGRISSLENQTILYRQHGQNEIGATNVRTFRYKLNKLVHYKEVKQALSNTYLQAGSLLGLYESKLSTEQRVFLTAYCDIPNHAKLGRWVRVCRLGVLKNGIERKIANLIFI